MRPITFERSQLIRRTAVEICMEIADVARWSEFKGYGLLPGIASAEYARRTEDMVGSQVRVRNTDGSEHVEEICAWDPEKGVIMKLHSFTPPLRRLATHFMEEWEFGAQSNGTLVTRKFQIFPKQPLARPVLWLISLLFRQAVSRHLADMAQERGAA